MTPARPENGGSRPVPDPTELTDKAIAKEAVARVESLDAMLKLTEAELRIRDERLAGIDEATKLRLGALPAITNEIDSKVAHAREIAAISLQAAAELSAAGRAHQREISDIKFQAAERLAARESELNALALAAAFAAQKEAAATQATTFGDALGSLGRIVETSLKALGDKVDDVKDRVGRIENVATGAISQRTEQRAQTTDVRAWILAAISAVGFLLLLADRLTK